MRVAQIMLISIVLAACGSSKKVVGNSENTAEKAVQVVETIQEDFEVQKDIKEEMEEEVIETVVEDITEDTDIEVAKTTLEIVETVFDHAIFDALLKKHVTDNGNVNYNGFRKDSPAFKTYLTALSNNVPKDDWKREDVLAYWINAYNAFTIKLIINNYPINSIKDIKDPWGLRFFKLGEKWFNLNEIEHKILRNMDEPRIHFAINCASVSCPQLLNEAFVPDSLESQLQKATKGFLADTTRNEIKPNTVKVSKIFKWFSKDFKKDGASIIDFLNTYSDIAIANNAKISYKDYDWNLNE